MRLPKLIRGHFIRRDNRFRATVTVAGREVWAHVPNSGRLTDLFTPGRPVWLAPAATPHRKTAYDLKLVELPAPLSSVRAGFVTRRSSPRAADSLRAEILVSVDARLPNPLFAEALQAGQLPDFDYPVIKSEARIGDSRLDFRLSGPEGVCWVETKSVTLVENRVALFPDAPTARGSKHLRQLIALRQQGYRAAVVFIIQRPDAHQFSPHHQADPVFAGTLRRAVAAGVEACAFSCRVSLDEIVIAGEAAVTFPFSNSS